ncbi:hypothetical protein ACKI1K_46535, partial [Streptomyces scabiei]|uniref:hypothetical protein n=1 Tax=Streptomyces scabiei TaxID=1930 RepID=UPI0038F6BEEC
MNDLSLLSDYVRERLGQTISTPFMERSRIQELARKYNTDYFLWTGSVSFTDVQSKKIGMAIMTVFLPY